LVLKKESVCTTAIYTVRKNQLNILLLVAAQSIHVPLIYRRHVLFVKKMKKYIPSELLSVLENWLSDCHTCIKWNVATSRFIKIYFGVRQLSFYRVATNLQTATLSIKRCWWYSYHKYS